MDRAAKGNAAGSITGEDQALAGLRQVWGGDWAFGCEDGRYRAARRDGTGEELTRASAAGLDLALRIGGR